MSAVLDPCSASRMMWFDKEDQRALFGDIRDEEHVLCDGRVLKVEPDVIMDFRDLPFADATFNMVVFDPPHLVRAGRESWLRLKYGILTDDWRDDLRKGFAECFRVLRPGQFLIFKWNETQVRVSEILALTDEQPLFGHKSGKREKDALDHLHETPITPIPLQPAGVRRARYSCAQTNRKTHHRTTTQGRPQPAARLADGDAPEPHP